MRDTHVQTVHYEITSAEDISYRDPPPLSFSRAC